MAQMIDKGDTYICAYCGKEYTADVPYDEAKKEHDGNFPGENIENAVVVCDDCFKDTTLEIPTPGMKGVT